MKTNRFPVRQLACTAALLILWVSLSPAVFAQTKEAGGAAAQPPGVAAIFAEARKAAPKDPNKAIDLYLQGLRVKPADLAARQEVARLLEKKGLLDEALYHYRQVNRDGRTKESYLDLIRALGKKGTPGEASPIAEEGAKAFPREGALQLLAGEGLVNLGMGRRAVPYLESARELLGRTPETTALLGRAYEQEGRIGEALTAYGQALEKDGSQALAKEGVRRLGAQAATIDRFWLIPPPGWKASGDRLIHPQTGQAVTLSPGTAGIPRDIALRLAMGTIPKGLFDGHAEDEARLKEAALRESKATGKKVTEDELRGRFGMDGLSQYVLISEEIKGPSPGFYAQIRVTPPGRDEKAPILSRCALSLAKGGQVLSFVTEPGRPEEAAACRSLLLSLSERLVPMPKGGIGK